MRTSTVFLVLVLVSIGVGQILEICTVEDIRKISNPP